MIILGLESTAHTASLGIMDDKGKILSAAGVIAVVYGLGLYLIENLSLPEYFAWGVGGVILVLVGWAKSSMAEK